MEIIDFSPQFDATDKDREMMGSTSAETEAATNPEVQNALDSKREKILSGRVSARFVYAKELIDMMAKGFTERDLGAVPINFPEFSEDQKFQEMITNHPRRDGASSKPFKGSDASWAWSRIAEDLTDWHYSSRAIHDTTRQLRNYREMGKAVKSEGQPHEEAREKFAKLLKEKAKWQLVEMYGYYTYEDLGRPDITDLLMHRNRYLEEDDREHLRAIFLKDDSEITKSDIRLLLRYGPEESRATPISLPYEIVELWDSKVAEDRHEWKGAFNFQTIPEGASVDGMLGIIVLSPSDKETVEKMTRLSLDLAKEDPNKAIVVMDKRLFEIFPEGNRDLALNKSS